jgi:hypothetical protein
MFLHRLKQLWSRVLARLAAGLHLSSSDPRRRETRSTSVDYSSSAATSTRSSGLASARWLDDTRRMRSRLTPTEEWTVHERHVRPTRPLRSDTTPIASSRPLDATREQRERSLPTQPQTAPFAVSPSNDAVSPSNDAAALPGGADEGAAAGEERRRLVGLKYLVRLGIYNEGFDASTTPDQYQRSLGMDEPES